MKRMLTVAGAVDSGDASGSCPSIGEMAEHFREQLRLSGSADAVRVEVEVSPGQCTTTAARASLRAWPMGVEAIAACVRAAGRLGLKVMPVASARNWGYGHGDVEVPRQDRLYLDLSRMKGIRSYDPVCGLVEIEPGVTQRELSEFLLQQGGKWVGPVTGSSPECCVLSNALERGFGLSAAHDHYALLRDLTVMLADGSLHASAMKKFGAFRSARLYRAGVGVDTLGLFSQSDLGIVCSATLALARASERGMILLSIPEDRLEHAVEAFREIEQLYGSNVQSLKLMNPDYLARVANVDPQVQTDWRGWVSVSAPRATLSQVMRAIARVLSRHDIASTRISPTLKNLVIRAQARGMFKVFRRLEESAAALAGIDAMASGIPATTGLRFAYGTDAMPAEPNPARDGVGLLWYSPIVRLESKDVKDAIRMIRRQMRDRGFAAPINITCLDGASCCLVSAVVFEPGSQSLQAQACYAGLVEGGLSLGCMPYRLADGHPLRDDAGRYESFSLHCRLRDALDPKRVFSDYRVQC